MSAQIVDLASRRPVPNSGNGAREAVLDYWNGFAAQNGIVSAAWSEMLADNLLGFLWNEGFKIVPLGVSDHEYDGPDWSGEEAPSS